MEINTKRMELLQQVMVNTLATAINERHPDDPIRRGSEEELFSRLPDLYDISKQVEFGQETGREYKYMPKHYKEMVLRLIAPFAGFQYRIDCNEAGYNVIAHLFLDCREKDQNPVSIGEAFVSFASLDQNMAEEDKKSYAKATAKGLAESKAMQKFGIGIWHTYQYEPEENPDVAEEEIQKNKDQTYVDPIGIQKMATDSVAPENNLPVESEQSEEPEQQTLENVLNPLTQGQGQTSEEVSVKAEKEAEPEKSKRGRKPKPKADPEPEVSADEDNNTDTEVKHMTADIVDDDGLTLEKAMSLPADNGKAKDRGLTLGETTEQYPGNLLWMYVSDGTSSLNKKAIEVIVKNNPELLELFSARNIIFE